MLTPMKLGESLLKLTAEYLEALDAENGLGAETPGFQSSTRPPSEIAADYEAEITRAFAVRL